ncbi:MAG: ATP-binding protein, partial [Bdellovibrio sp.]
CFELEEKFAQFLSETKEILGASATSDERQIEIAISKLNHIARKVGGLPGGGPVAQELLLELMMEPVGHFLEPYKDTCWNLAQKLNKSLAPLKISTHSVMVVPEIYNSLFSTLIHALRNAVDHGIESPEIRQRAGKSMEGSIEIDVQVDTSAAHIMRILVKDDGCGIDPQRIRAKLGDRVSPHESDFEVIQHIFDSQFSTREQVTEISGRGVGMDAIKKAAEDLQGRAWVESIPGQGSSLFIEVPYLTEFKKNSSEQPPQAA